LSCQGSVEIDCRQDQVILEIGQIAQPRCHVIFQLASPLAGLSICGVDQNGRSEEQHTQANNKGIDRFIRKLDRAHG
jgi:hypothetical protein